MYYIGLDLGQANDPTALVIGEKIKDKKSGVLQFHARHAERFSLGTGYPDVVDKTYERVNAVGMGTDYMVLPDATGVGRPVIDMMRQRGIRMVPIMITSGGNELFDPKLGGWKLPKRDLVGNLQVMLQSGTLKIAQEMYCAREIVDELLKFKIKVTRAGNDTYEAWRESDHDDLVLGLAMAAWYAMKYGSTTEQVTQRRYAGLQENPWLRVKGI